MAKHKRTLTRGNGHADSSPARVAGPRPFWSGTISFGLVSVPVDLFPASRGKRGGLRVMDADGTPLARRFYCPADNKQVHPEHIVRGYEVGEGDYVVVRDEELESLLPKKSREIDLVQFVDWQDIPPLLVERTYILTPAGETNKAYRLLAEVIEKGDKAGIATFVMRDREYLVAITAAEGILRAHTLRFEGEVRRPEEVGLPPPTKVARRDVAAMEREIARLAAAELDTAILCDEHEEQLSQLAEAKRRKGKDVTYVEEPTPADDEVEDSVDEQVDLLETIRRNLAGRKMDRESTSSDDSKSMTEQPKEELYERAAALDIPGRSKMTKAELIRAIRRRG